MSRKNVILLSSLALMTALTGCTPESSSTTGTTTSSAASTKLGGNLVVYSPNSDAEIEGLLYFWGEKYGVTVELQSMSTGEVTAKLLAEKNNPQADIRFGGMNLGVYKQNPELYESYVAKGDNLLPEGYQNKTGFFTNYLLSGSNLLVNTTLERALGITVTGYADLLNPLLKGKISMGNAANSSSAFAQLTNMLLVMGDGTYLDDKGWDYVDAFVKNLDKKIIASSSAVFRGVASGEYVVGVTYEDPSVQLLTDGATNLRIVYPKEGAVWLPAASALIKGSKNQANGKAFLDWLISEEGQTQVAKGTNRPVNTKINNTNPYLQPFTAINLAFEDIELVANNRAALVTRFTQTVTRNA
jgi:iron(III) transport system substrate-binding protein